ncbi:PGF-CTERM sorting domain-containing protein [Halomicrobium salinisoli]|uniref:PGF-CTERM sorting domain-containing protein n=1 Tax=Halomicrobium salinisoli TaxID=2878391 RepID=UPI001CF00E69|nr:PGF-CTERM sorting domain-containing protein [Halomicrobium salinisoli]
MTARVTVGLVGLVAVMACALLASGGAAAQVAPDCPGSGDGALFAADGGLTVEYAAGTSVGEGETYRNASALRFGPVTVVADGTASLRLDAVGETVCAADVNATETPIGLATDGRPAVRVAGRASTFAVTTADPSDVDLAYEAAEPITVAVGRPDGATDRLTAVDAATDETVATATGDPARLVLPAGRHRIALVATTGTAEPSATAAARGDSNATSRTATGTRTTDTTRTATAPSGDDAAGPHDPGPGTAATRATASTGETATTERGPGFGVPAALAGFAAAALLGRYRR